MKSLKCNSCGEEWYVREGDLEKLKVCPYCTAQIQSRIDFDEYDSFDKAVYGAVRRMGVDVLLRPAQLSAFMKDMAPKIKKEVTIFSRFINDEHARRIRNAFDLEQEAALSAMRQLQHIFVGEGLAEEWADTICNGFYGAIMYVRGVGTTQMCNVAIRDHTEAVPISDHTETAPIKDLTEADPFGSDDPFSSSSGLGAFMPTYEVGKRCHFTATLIETHDKLGLMDSLKIYDWVMEPEFGARFDSQVRIRTEEGEGYATEVGLEKLDPEFVKAYVGNKCSFYGEIIKYKGAGSVKSYNPYAFGVTNLQFYPILSAGSDSGNDEEDTVAREFLFPKVKIGEQCEFMAEMIDTEEVLPDWVQYKIKHGELISAEPPYGLRFTLKGVQIETEDGEETITEAGIEYEDSVLNGKAPEFYIGEWLRYRGHFVKCQNKGFEKLFGNKKREWYDFNPYEYCFVIEQIFVDT